MYVYMYIDVFTLVRRYVDGIRTWPLVFHCPSQSAVIPHGVRVYTYTQLSLLTFLLCLLLQLANVAIVVVDILPVRRHMTLRRTGELLVPVALALLLFLQLLLLLCCTFSVDYKKFRESEFIVMPRSKE